MCLGEITHINVCKSEALLLESVRKLWKKWEPEFLYGVWWMGFIVNSLEIDWSILKCVDYGYPSLVVNMRWKPMYKCWLEWILVCWYKNDYHDTKYLSYFYIEWIWQTWLSLPLPCQATPQNIRWKEKKQRMFVVAPFWNIHQKVWWSMVLII